MPEIIGLWFWLALLTAQGAPIVRGLDHIPLAVNDLARAKRDFQRLGFILKPGRHHDDGITNAHVKFADHTEIELITAHAASDRLSTEYVNWLRNGDGPAFWGLYAPSLEVLAARLDRLGLAPKYDEIVTFSQRKFPHQLFFADREPSPTDLPVYFDHPNTAYHLQAVWLAGRTAEADLLTHLGNTHEQISVCAPFAAQADARLLDDGDVLFVAGVHHNPSRAIIAATVLVRRLAAVRHILRVNHVGSVEMSGCGHASIWILPGEAHGIWLEFRQ